MLCPFSSGTRRAAAALSLCLCAAAAMAQTPPPPSQISVMRLATFSQPEVGNPIPTGARFAAFVGQSPAGVSWVIVSPFWAETPIPLSGTSDRLLVEDYSDPFFFGLDRPGGYYTVRASGPGLDVEELLLEVGGVLADSPVVHNLGPLQSIAHGIDATLMVTPPAGATGEDRWLLEIRDTDTGELLYASPDPLSPTAVPGNAFELTFPAPQTTANLTGRLTWLRLSTSWTAPSPWLADTPAWAGSGSSLTFPLRLERAAVALDRYLGDAGLTPGSRAPLADPDGDGLSNLEEWFWGTSPAQPGMSPLPQPVATDRALVWELDVPAFHPSLTVAFEYLSELHATPQPVDHLVASVTPGRMLLRVSMPLSADATTGFLRLRLNLNAAD